MGGRRGRFSETGFGIFAFAELKSALSCKTPRLSDTPWCAEQPPTWKEKHPWDTATWMSVCNTQDSKVRDSAGPVWGAPVGPGRSRPKEPGKPVRTAETVLRCSGENCWENGGTFLSPSIFFSAGERFPRCVMGKDANMQTSSRIVPAQGEKLKHESGGGKLRGGRLFKGDKLG